MSQLKLKARVATAIVVPLGIVLLGLVIGPKIRGTEEATASEVSESLPSRWGANYFPNYELVTHEGKPVRFFDDLIKDKVVMINFIYTSCPDSCPLETARLAEVANILGDRVGDDVFIYSITIDPKTDTPQVLKDYRARYGAGPGWVFLTGKENELVELRKKLGLYIPEIQAQDSSDHNLSLIIGNQKTGRWMKRSPFENPHVLATQVGSWLHNWKAPSTKKRDFGSAPSLRQIGDGERLFRTRCAACHTIGGQSIGGARINNNTVGPDLLDVSSRREESWLRRWITEPDVMLEEGDPQATALFEKFNKVPMPNMRLAPPDVDVLLQYLGTETLRSKSASQKKGTTTVIHPWIRAAHPDAKVNGGYFSLKNDGPRPITLRELSSPNYAKVELHEMKMSRGAMKMSRLRRLVTEPGKTSNLKPGGKHLMLIGPKKPLKAGDSTTVTLKFESGAAFEIVVPVRDEAP